METNKSKEIIDEAIDRFLSWFQTYKETDKNLIDDKELKEIILKPLLHIQAMGHIDEQLHIIRKYADKEQLKRIRKGLGDYRYNKWFRR